MVKEIAINKEAEKAKAVAKEEETKSVIMARIVAADIRKAKYEAKKEAQEKLEAER